MPTTLRVPFGHVDRQQINGFREARIVGAEDSQGRRTNGNAARYGEATFAVRRWYGDKLIRMRQALEI